MGKTFAHTRNAETETEIKRRQGMRQRLSAFYMRTPHDSPSLADFDDVTLADLAGTGLPRNAQEG